MNDSYDLTKQNHAIVLAAGSGERSGLAGPKQFETVLGKPMLRHSVENFLSHPAVVKTWLVVGEGQRELAESALSGLEGVVTVIGGNTRQQSVLNGLNAIRTAGGADNVLIHDAARPFLKHDLIDRLLAALAYDGGAIPILPTIDTTITVTHDYVEKPVDRGNLWRVQTPQAFRFEEIYGAHKRWPTDSRATDDAQIFRNAGHRVKIVQGDESLSKYTLPGDFDRIDMPLPSHTNVTRTGIGFDVHRLAKGEDLWLGGIKVDHDFGLVGHSDADVLLHALTDALLGTIGAGDIGDHFPPSDPKWAGANSSQFVTFAVELIAAKGGIINNVDMTIICEAPKIKPYREAIKQNIAKMLELSDDQISVKATTTEGLGFTGRREGIAAQAMATITMEAT